MGLALGQCHHRARVGELAPQVHDRQPELLAEHRGQITLGERPLGDQVLAEALAGLRRAVEGLHELLGGERAPAHEQLTQHAGVVLDGPVLGPAGCGRGHRRVDPCVARRDLRLERLDRQRHLGVDAVGVQELVLVDVVEISVLDRVDVPLELVRGFLAGLQQTHAVSLPRQPSPERGSECPTPTHQGTGRTAHSARGPGTDARGEPRPDASRRRPETPS